MDTAGITNLIGSLGFPIVCCLVMFYQNSQLQKTLGDLTTALTTMNERISDIEDAVKKED